MRVLKIFLATCVSLTLIAAVARTADGKNRVDGRASDAADGASVPSEATRPDPAETRGPDDVVDETEAADDDGDSVDRQSTAPGPTVGQRVYITVDRRTTVTGTIELEDDDVIVIRQRDDLRSLPKARILRIVRLVDVRPEGHPGIVYLGDGRIRRGIILDDGFDEVVVLIEGIRTVLPRATVDFVELEPSFEERLARFRELIGPHDHIRRLELARWLMSERQYDIAREELLTILDAAEMPEARQLLRIINAQMLLETRDDRRHGDRDQPDGRTPAVGSEGRDRSGPVRERDLLPTALLTLDDVNIIRVFEMDLRRPPRVSVSPDTIRSLIEQNATSDLIPTGAARTALFRADPLDIVRLMFQLRARDLYPEIQVHTEPYHLNLFRQRVHNAWLIPNCATSRCHGGLDGGALFLHNRNHKDERVRYTNLLILDQTKINGRPLVDYEDPAMSLIIQHALPRHQARLPHPDVRGWRPVLGETNRRLAEDAIAWIRAMHLPRPHYPIQFEVPVLQSPDAEFGSDDSGPAAGSRDDQSR